MATTTNLMLPLVEASQAQKEVTINEAFVKIDTALGMMSATGGRPERLAVNVANANVTLTVEQLKHEVIEVQGLTVTDRTIIIPDTAPIYFSLLNQCRQTAALRIRFASQTDAEAKIAPRGLCHVAIEFNTPNVKRILITEELSIAPFGRSTHRLFATTNGAGTFVFKTLNGKVIRVNRTAYCEYTLKLMGINPGGGQYLSKEYKGSFSQAIAGNFTEIMPTTLVSTSIEHANFGVTNAFLSNFDRSATGGPIFSVTTQNASSLVDFVAILELDVVHNLNDVFL
jgi:hypothetical protein